MGKKMSNVLALLAHPDDEVLGAGGTLAKYRRDGESITVAFCGDGMQGQLSIAKRLWKSAALMGGTTDQQFESLPIRLFADFAKAQLDAEQPSMIITHSPSDMNRDHQIVYEAVMIACRRAPTLRLILGCQGDRHIRTFEPNHFVNIIDHWPTKLHMLNLYRQFLLPYPDPRSIEGQEARARYWGTVAGVPMAEAFEVLREVC